MAPPESQVIVVVLTGVVSLETSDEISLKNFFSFSLRAELILKSDLLVSSSLAVLTLLFIMKNVTAA